MYRLEKTWREDRFLNEAKNPSFSSTLLDKIYRSIDEGERKSGDMKFYRETTTTGKKQNSRAIEKLMDKKVTTEKVGTQYWTTQVDGRNSRHEHVDHDVVFFSSTSSSSDSSSGGLSSSDTESVYGMMRSRASSCFAPSRPKPVRTSMSEKADRTRRHSSLGVQTFDGSHNSSAGSNIGSSNEEGLIKSKSRALKIYNNLKKVKQPISPGGKLTNFLNSLFTTGNTKKTKGASSVGGYEDANAERKAKSGQASTCSSASSFSRSCLSKTSPSSREKMRNNGVKRTVRFYPVSVIVGEDSRPCGHKCLYEEEEEEDNTNTSLMSVSVPTAWKIGRSPTKKSEKELKFPFMEKSEAAREFLKEYHRNHNKSDLASRDFNVEEEDDEDDAASYSSSDLFELDHLAVMGNNSRYCEELPVYETTHVSTNRAIANGLIM